MPHTDPDPVLLEEHRALRDEILLRVRQQHQLLALAWVACAVLLGLGLRLGDPRLPALYVLLATFVAASWQHNGARTVQLKVYLRDELEPRLFGGTSGWERFLASSRVVGLLGSCWFLSTKGFLIGSQTLATFLVFQRRGRLGDLWLALVLAVAAQLLTLVILRYPKLERRSG